MSRVVVGGARERRHRRGAPVHREDTRVTCVGVRLEIVDEDLVSSKHLAGNPVGLAGTAV